MGRRTLAGHRLGFNVKRKPKELLSPADLSGKSLSDWLANWAEEKKAEGIIETSSQSYLRIDEVIRWSPSVVLIHTMAGKAGEQGEIIDSSDNSVKFTISETDIPASSSRALLVCPPRGTMALWFSEYSTRSSGARMLLSYFEKCWSKLETGITFTDSRLIESDAPLANGVVTELEVRFSKQADDRADGEDYLAGVISHRFKFTKGKRLSGRIIETIRQNPEKAYDLMELKRGDALTNEEIFVSVDIEGKRRKIQVFNPDDGLYFREELNDSVHPVLSDDEFVRYCSERSASFLKRSGQDWDYAWSQERI